LLDLAHAIDAVVERLALAHRFCASCGSFQSDESSARLFR
jgi:hypothetical protein